MFNNTEKSSSGSPMFLKCSSVLLGQLKVRWKNLWYSQLRYMATFDTIDIGPLVEQIYLILLALDSRNLLLTLEVVAVVCSTLDAVSFSRGYGSGDT